MGARDMSSLMDDLVNEARSSRDSTFNALDAVERESARNTQRLAAQVERYVKVHETSMAEILQLELPRLLAEREDAHSGPAAAERDARFDPEDEWELDEVRPAAPPASTVRRDDDDYPETWLR